jgi:DNA-binding transcriptional MerR regulator
VVSTISIGELSARTGVPTSALRYWDGLGLVRPVERRSGHRRYSDRQIHRVGVVLACQRAGFSLAEIGELLHASAGRRRRMTEAKIAAIDVRMREAERARAVLANSLRCDCERLEDCGLIER